ncbi:hypothetical protein ESCO_002422 [Escovopsis weberi]|uniref:DUF1275 domain-containing protein n=1 Tax=Escovopsis weberi TaxID=150374 RepID=A0A0M8MRJ0_ESCWE|nr:hypothetical protein ESCO_002422 [Escovopsis weberi]
MPLYDGAGARRPNDACSDDEGRPLLGGKGKPLRLAARLRRRMMAEVSATRADMVLIFCYMITGLLDSASTMVWGAFVSMQTGNTVFVGLGLASLAHPPVSARLYRSGISLLSFCLGSFLFARFHRLFSPKRRWVLCASFAAQAALVAAAALIVGGAPSAAHGDPAAHDWTVLAPLALIALQSCGQAVVSRALKHNALTSVVLTSIYCDLFSDQALFAPGNRERDRRAAAPVSLLLGAVVGGLVSHTAAGITGVLWIAVALKSMIVVIWALWPAEPSLDGDDEI